MMNQGLRSKICSKCKIQGKKANETSTSSKPITIKLIYNLYKEKEIKLLKKHTHTQTHTFIKSHTRKARKILNYY